MSGRPRPWTTGEERELARLAGRVPKAEVCRRLRRSTSSVERRAAQLRARGVECDLRYHEPATQVCPACGRASATLGDEGICEACRLSRRLARTEAETARLLAGLPAAQRAVYADTEAERQSGAEPMPVPRPTAGLPRYEAALAEEANELDMEGWRVRRLTRLLKAAQRRKERIARKLADQEGRA